MLSVGAGIEDEDDEKVGSLLLSRVGFEQSVPGGLGVTGARVKSAGAGELGVTAA